MGTEGFALSLPFLARTGAEALAIHCPLGCGCAHEVASNGDAVAVCVCEGGGGCPDIPLTRGELEIFALRVETLGREAARALNCRPLGTVIERNHLWQIGAWSTEGVPVLMTLDSGAQALTRVVQLCAARFRSRIILLAADPSLVNAHARAMLDAAGSGLFGLPALLRQSAPGRFAPRKPPEEVFCAFTTAAAEGDSSSMQKAFALLQKLESKSPATPPGLATVFKLYCMDNLPASEIALKCGCSKTTVVDRLARIRRATGLNPAVFRNVVR
jgi:hypothetical protein